MIKKRKFAEKQKTKKCKTEHTAYKIATWQKGTNYTTSPRVKLLIFLGRGRPSLLPADRSLLASGDSCCCCYYGAPLEVCLNGVAPPPLSMLLGVASRCSWSIGNLTKWRAATRMYCFEVYLDLGVSSISLCSKIRTLGLAIPQRLRLSARRW